MKLFAHLETGLRTVSSVVAVAISLVVQLLLPLSVSGPVEVELVVSVHPPGVGLVVRVEGGGLAVVLDVLLTPSRQQDQRLQLGQAEVS